MGPTATYDPASSKFGEFDADPEARPLDDQFTLTLTREELFVLAALVGCSNRSSTDAALERRQNGARPIGTNGTGLSDAQVKVLRGERASRGILQMYLAFNEALSSR